MLPGNMESPGDGSESGDVETGNAVSPTPDLVTVTVPGCQGCPFLGPGCQRFKGWSGPVPRLVGRRDFAKSAPPGRETGDPKIIKNSGNDLRRNKLIY